MRISLTKEQIKTETYILPLVRTTQYNELRRIAGDGTVKIDPSIFSDKTLVQYLMHFSPRLFDRDLFGLGGDLMVDLAAPQLARRLVHGPLRRQPDLRQAAGIVHPQPDVPGGTARLHRRPGPLVQRR